MTDRTRSERSTRIAVAATGAAPGAPLQRRNGCQPDGFGGAVCANAGGSGGIDEPVDLPAGAGLLYELTATVTATEGQIVTNTATVTLAAGQTDIDPGNNSATDADPVGLFADGFEIE
ncbi:hypothetical protein HFP89_13635 [Wenzhouxiangella sp. XN79A]|uniref:DUF11 domain-containing protein n=1 Tax=Wenzhouxiangella sp. XN79A TaxID=2724193 RepID=UPI00144AE1C2|nr:DUF11 domain-containing protein [Wenzhouxiangella sp. XN79A]NKI36206.1 hypothetical protein [Wenzhouxiangella sp. XN79A]